MIEIEDRRIEVARRKERLIARAEAERDVIAASFRRLEAPAGVIDRGLAVIHFLREHPLLVAAGVSAIVAIRGRGLLSMAGRGFAAWRVFRSLAAWAARF